MKSSYYKEFFTFPDVLIMIILFAPAMVYTLMHVLSWGIWVAFVIGMASYALSEYVVHRFLFHMEKPNNPTLLNLIKRLHYDHHVDPNDLKLLFLPLWFSLPGFAIASGICFWITGDLQLTVAYLAGLMAYFLYYEWKHYIAHRSIQPKTKLGKRLKKTHLWHHYKNENYWYGVTHIKFDKTFGTYREHNEVEKSETARNLEKRA